MKKYNYKYIEKIVTVRLDSNEKYVAKFITKSARFNNKNKDTWIHEEQMLPCLYQKVRRHYLEDMFDRDTSCSGGTISSCDDTGTSHSTKETTF